MFPLFQAVTSYTSSFSPFELHLSEKIAFMYTLAVTRQKQHWQAVNFNLSVDWIGCECMKINLLHKYYLLSLIHGNVLGYRVTGKL
jgi:uncharacterized membrane protein